MGGCRVGVQRWTFYYYFFYNLNHVECKGFLGEHIQIINEENIHTMSGRNLSEATM